MSHCVRHRSSRVDSRAAEPPRGDFSSRRACESRQWPEGTRRHRPRRAARVVPCGTLPDVNVTEEERVPKKHGLGFGNGKIMEYEDGSAGYVPTGQFTQAFRVQIADVMGFSVTKG